VEVTGAAVRPTLIRNNYYAYNHWTVLDPMADPRVAERFGTDEGVHSLRLALAADKAASPDALESLLDQYQSPPYAWDDYRGASRVSAFE